MLRLASAKRAGGLEAELERLGRIPLGIVDDVATSSAWPEIFGDPVAIAAMIDRFVHHAEVLVLRGHSYRLKGKRKEVQQPEAAS